MTTQNDLEGKVEPNVSTRKVLKRTAGKIGFDGLVVVAATGLGLGYLATAPILGQLPYSFKEKIYGEDGLHVATYFARGANILVGATLGACAGYHYPSSSIEDTLSNTLIGTVAGAAAGFALNVPSYAVEDGSGKMGATFPGYALAIPAAVAYGAGWSLCKIFGGVIGYLGTKYGESRSELEGEMKNDK